MKYTRPEVEVIELEIVDVIQTSITTDDPENPTIPEKPGTGSDELPYN